LTAAPPIVNEEIFVLEARSNTWMLSPAVVSFVVEKSVLCNGRAGRARWEETVVVEREREEREGRGERRR